MPKALAILGMVVAALILLIFGLDMAVGFPFKKVNPLMDIAFILCAGALGYMSWTTLREQH
jgi:hypothetical protein